MKNVRTNADFCALYMKTEQNNFTQKAKKVLTFSVFVIEYISLGSIAQLGEHLPYKQRVTGSSPVVPTKESRLHFCVVCFFMQSEVIVLLLYQNE